MPGTSDVKNTPVSQPLGSQCLPTCATTPRRATSTEVGGHGVQWMSGVHLTAGRNIGVAVVPLPCSRPQRKFSFMYSSMS